MNRRSILLRTSLLLATGLFACGDDDGGSGGPRVAGNLRVFQPGTASSAGKVPSTMVHAAAQRLLAGQPRRSALSAQKPGAALARATVLSDAGFVPGELVLSFREGGAEEVEALRHTPGLAGYRFSIRTWGGPRVAAVRIADAARGERTIDAAETARVRDRLARHRALRAVELNHYRRGSRVPGDPGYELQWHYPAINLPAAWEQITGRAQVVVAVIDDGVRPHPELAPRLLPGYDMISDTAISGDGDGRDADPSEVAGTHGGHSVWHGTHVAGTIGASSDDGTGVAGVDWACRIVPIRVLGVVQPQGGAGTDIDILAGMYWSVGVDVPGLPSNPNPAQVVNLSLGGGAASQAGQDAVNELVARGAAVVVAAGNENVDAGGLFLAGYDNVITVGAIDLSGKRAPYSNYGATIDVMAPGGNVEADVNADGRPDGVLSTYLDQSGTQYAYEFLQGTSMAAPHVAGVVALMKAVQPQLSPTAIELMLKQTADPGARCAEGCGEGLINAAAAVLAASGANINAPATLKLSTDRLNLGGLDRGQLSVFNAGGGTLSYSATLGGPGSEGVSIDEGATGSVGPAGSSTISLRISRDGLADGVHEASIEVRAGAQSARAKILFSVGAAALADIGPVAVGTFVVDDRGEVTVGGEATVQASSRYAYSFGSRTGRWFVIAIADRNGNQTLDAGDYFGLYASTDDPRAIDVGASGASGIDFALSPFSAGAPVEQLPCADYRRCIEQCNGAAACENGCTVSAGCEACLASVIQGCGAQAGCGTSFSCLCGSCSAALDACLGPLSCGGGGGGGGGGAVIGASCGTCQQGLVCDTSVTGGYCTRDCLADSQCPSAAACVPFDQNDDGTTDSAFCFATCSGPGTCPRPQDSCTNAGGISVCVPS